MVCNFICSLSKGNHMFTTAENLVSVWALFTKLHPYFHSMCIAEFHAKLVVTCNLKVNTSVLFC